MGRCKCVTMTKKQKKEQYLKMEENLLTILKKQQKEDKLKYKYGPKRCCANCAYMHIDEGAAHGTMGRCHRYPPQHIGILEWKGPYISVKYWCGEFAFAESKMRTPYGEEWRQ